MALYKCENCGEEVAYGWLPTTSCGLLIMLQFGLAVNVAAVLAPVLKHFLHLRFNPLQTLTLNIVLFFTSLCGAFTLPHLLERLLLYRHRCPKCQKRAWSRAFTKGFGL